MITHKLFWGFMSWGILFWNSQFLGCKFTVTCCVTVAGEIPPGNSGQSSGGFGQDNSKIKLGYNSVL